MRAVDAIDLLSQGEVWWSKFAYAAKALPADTIRTLLARLQREIAKDKGVLTCAVHYLTAMVGDATSDEALVGRWRAALAGLDGLQMYSESHAKKAKKLKRLAGVAQVLAAWQTAVVASQTVARDALALLIIDATDASLDALLPHFERARGDHALLEQLESLQRYQSPATTALFASVKGTLSTKRAASPVLALGERFGLATKGRFQLKVVIRATKPAKRSTYDEVCLTFDSNEVPGYFLTRGQETTSATSSSSWHREVKTPLNKLPQALARVARDAKVQWNFEQATTRPLGRAKAARLLDWLAGRAPQNVEGPDNNARTSLRSPRKRK